MEGLTGVFWVDVPGLALLPDGAAVLLVESVMVVSLVAGELATVPGVAAVEAVTLEAVIRDAELPDDVGTADDTAVATIDPPMLSGAADED